jgi:ribonuclease HI
MFLSYFKPLEIYTDGSHKGKWGSWAFVVVKYNKIIYEASGRVRGADSNSMEFQAAIEALTYLKPKTKACIYSDSRILINCLSSKDERALELINLAPEKYISWKWVKAHNGNIYNERCDELCIKARTEQL